MFRLPDNLIGRLFIFWVIIITSAQYAFAEGSSTEKSVGEMTLEELLNVPVTIAAKHEQPLMDTSAAVYVITRDEIKHSGAFSIPEALRVVPGMQVSRVNASKWVVGARGFSDIFSNKLLVLVDGRSVYSPLVAGVLWDMQDIMIEDIERIEVIRGPGASLWGANAVNGVINIVTKNALDVRDNLCTLLYADGDRDRTFALRRVADINDHTSIRLYTKNWIRGGSTTDTGHSASDMWNQDRFGFRMDGRPSKSDSFTLQADNSHETSHASYNYGGLAQQYQGTYNSTITTSGWNALLRGTRTSSDGTRRTLQLFYDSVTKNDPFLFGWNIDTVDADFQMEWHPGEVSTIVGGIGYRHYRTRLTDGMTTLFACGGVNNYLYNAFGQVDQTVFPDKLRVIYGAKLEHNDYTGYEFQPSFRTVWTPNNKMMMWSAVSRASRTPPMSDFFSLFHATAPPDSSGTPRLVSISSNLLMKSEKLTSYELGHRIQPLNNLSIDVAAYINQYDYLRSIEPGKPFMDTNGGLHRHVPYYIANNYTGQSKGLEVTADYIATANWRLKASMSTLQISLSHPSGEINMAGTNMENTYPKRQINLLSYWTVPGGVQLDTVISYVSACETPSLTQESVRIPEYTRVDLNVGFPSSEGSELGIGVHNILRANHVEAGSAYGEVLTNIPRSFYAKYSLKF